MAMTSLIHQQPKSSILQEARQLSLPPYRKKGKYVRFADSIGLDLAAVRHILQDDLPHIPQSAYTHLQVPNDFEPSKGYPNGMPVRRAVSTLTEPVVQYLITPSKPKRLPPWMALYQQQQQSSLIPEFIEPSVQVNFLERVRKQKAGLENCYISTGAGSISVTCVIRVMNLSFEKQVVIRYTVDDWKSHRDCLASYIPNSNDGWSDRFTATFHVSTATGGSLHPGQRVQFAVKYNAASDEFWDNNNSLNYSLVYRV